MNIVFFGSGKFALKSLEALVASGRRVNLAVTQPDKPKGRHLAFQPTEVKKKAQELGLNIIQPQNPNSQDSVNALKGIPADLYIVISYGHMLKEPILQLPKLYALNVHASLLPKYRGAAPIAWAIINGETETGISIIRMTSRMDAGDILLQKKMAIMPADTAESLEEKLAILAADALPEALGHIEKKMASFTAQDETRATYAAKLRKEQGRINWNMRAGDIERLIRGLYPWPCAYAYHKGKMIKIYKARALDYPETLPGKVLAISKEKIAVGCIEGAVEIFELQPENGKRMSAAAFNLGHKLHPHDTFS